MRVCIIYNEYLESYYYSEEEFGDWEEVYSSDVECVVRLDDNEPAPYCRKSETFLIPDGYEYVYVVYINYNTGDSFGRAYGKISIIHCTVSEESAYALAEKIKENPETYTIEFVDDFGRNISLYNEASGYFERINNIHVEKFYIQDKKKFIHC
jgi:hypothetical protein